MLLATYYLARAQSPLAAYNALSGPKELELYEWDGHDGGQGHFSARSVAFANALLGR